jgi:hypothetical protein
MLSMLFRSDTVDTSTLAARGLRQGESRQRPGGFWKFMTNVVSVVFVRPVASRKVRGVVPCVRVRREQRILAEEAARREAIFQQSVHAERTRGDALSRRFEEALRQAREEPIEKPKRDFDLD